MSDIFEQLVTDMNAFLKSNEYFSEHDVQTFLANKLVEKNRFVSTEDNLKHLWDRATLASFDVNKQHFPFKSEGIDIVLYQLGESLGDVNFAPSQQYNMAESIVPIEIKILRKAKYVSDYGSPVDETCGLIVDKCSGDIGGPNPEKEKNFHWSYKAQFIDVIPSHITKDEYATKVYTNRKEGQLLWDLMRGIRLLATDGDRIQCFYLVCVAEIGQSEAEIKHILNRLGTLYNLSSMGPVYYKKKLDRKYVWNIALSDSEKEVAKQALDCNNGTSMFQTKKWTCFVMKLNRNKKLIEG